MQPGDRIGPYRLDAVLGRGGMGTVFEATDTRLDRRVAVKLLSGAASSTTTSEAETLAAIDAPHVVPVFDHGRHPEPDGTAYLVMQLAEGGTLADRLAERGTLRPTEAIEICAQVADALAATHAVGLVHRDVKPSNVLLGGATVPGTAVPHVWLADFGIARRTDAVTSSRAAGSWHYLPPERTRGELGGPAGDLYSLGCVLVECLTGAPPFTGTEPQVAIAHAHEPAPPLPAHLGTEIAALVQTCLAKDPAERPSSAAELREALRGLSLNVAGTGVAPRRRTVRRWLAAAAAVAAVGVAVGISTGSTDGPFESLRDRIASTDGPSTDDSGSTVSGSVDLTTGDLDGDGFGDLVTIGERSLWLVPGGPDGLGDPREWRPAPTSQNPLDQVLTGMVDENGSVQVVEVAGGGSDLRIDVDEQQNLFRIPDIGLGDERVGLVEEDGLSVATVSGDRLRIRSYARLPNTSGLTELGVAHRGRVDPDASRRWATGDVTGDEFADVVLHEAFDESARLSVYSADADGLDSRPRRLAIEAEPGIAILRVGDVDGDGTQEAVVLSAGTLPRVWEWTGTGLQPRAGSGDPMPAITDADLSDVDGDGLLDVTFLEAGRAGWARSTGAGFEIESDSVGLTDSQTARGLLSTEP